MHQLQWCLKTMGQILEGSRKPGQIPCNTQDPDPANIHINVPSSFELSRSAPAPEAAVPAQRDELQQGAGGDGGMQKGPGFAFGCFLWELFSKFYFP